MPEEPRPADPSNPAQKTRPAAEKPQTPAEKPETPPASIYLVPYPKIILLYPILLAAVGAAITMHLLGGAGDQVPGRGAVMVAEIFLGITAVNLVILAFDFPRTTSLTLFFFVVAIVMGFVLLVTFKPGVMPFLKDWLAQLHPAANATFYWGVAIVITGLYLAVFVSIRFDYGNPPQRTASSPRDVVEYGTSCGANLRIEKEINDVFEYFLLRSGRLILHPSDDRRAIILDNVPFIDRKEASMTRMLGALQVQIRKDG